MIPFNKFLFFSGGIFISAAIGYKTNQMNGYICFGITLILMVLVDEFLEKVK